MSKMNKMFPLIVLLSVCFSSFSFGEESNRIAVVVNSKLKREISENLRIYMEDLENEKYEPILKEWDLENNPEPQKLKAYLRELYLDDKSLQGAVFIGDLPVPKMQAHSVLMFNNAQTRIDDGYIAEMYYMDLIGKEWKAGSWPHNGSRFVMEDGCYEADWENFYEKMKDEEYRDTYFWEILSEDLSPTPEIWTSRIMASGLEDSLKRTESGLVNAYLEKNHAYRTGKVVFQKQSLLYSLNQSVKDTMDVAAEVNESIVQRLLSNHFLLKDYNPGPSTVSDFFAPLENQSYEIMYWHRHGEEDNIKLGSQWLRSTHLLNPLVNIAAAFVFPTSCSIGYYKDSKYFAGIFMFNERSYVLGMPTATLPIHGHELEREIIEKFQLGDNLGLAFKKSILARKVTRAFIKAGMDAGESHYLAGLDYFASCVVAKNSRFILGDGTLRLQSTKSEYNENNSPQNYIKNKCKDSDKCFSSAELYVKNYYGKTLREIIIKCTLMDYNLGKALCDLFFGQKDLLKDLAFLDETIVTDGNIEDLKFFIEKELIAKDNFDNLLFLAIARETIDIVKFMLEQGVNVNFKASYFEDNTPLHLAVQKGNIEIIKLLIKGGADVHVENKLGKKPLDLANASLLTHMLDDITSHSHDL